MPADLSADEKNAYQQFDFFFNKGIGYAKEMSIRPQTLYGIDDSPIGLAAWMLDHDIRSYEFITRVFDGQKEGLTKMIFWTILLLRLTNRSIFGPPVLGGSFQVPTAGFFDPSNVQIPVAVSVFPDEIYAAPETWADESIP